MRSEIRGELPAGFVFHGHDGHDLRRVRGLLAIWSITRRLGEWLKKIFACGSPS